MGSRSRNSREYSPSPHEQLAFDQGAPRALLTDLHRVVGQASGCNFPQGTEQARLARLRFRFSRVRGDRSANARPYSPKDRSEARRPIRTEPSATCTDEHGSGARFPLPSFIACASPASDTPESRKSPKPMTSRARRTFSLPAARRSGIMRRCGRRDRGDPGERLSSWRIR